MKTAFRLIILLSMFSNATAQDSTIQYRAPRVILKLAPLSLLDPDATIQGAMEVRVSQRNAVQVEAGLGEKGIQIINDDKRSFSDWSIWRVRSEYRHYTSRYRTNTRKNITIRSPFPLGNYWAIEGFAKEITGKKSFSNPIFQTGRQQISRYVVGGHVKWGRQIAIPGASLQDLSRVLLDFYVGLGVRYGITDLTPDTPDALCGCGLIDNRFMESRRVNPSVAAGVKIGFGL